MANSLKMAQVNTIETLLKRGWPKRRIARELGIHRETVSRYARLLAESDSKPAISTPGSQGGVGSKPAIPTPGARGRRSECAAYHDTIVAKLEIGLQAHRQRGEEVTGIIFNN